MRAHNQIPAGEAYQSRATEYDELFGDIASTAAADREFVGAWAGSLPGPLLDVGCGPGQWSGWLREQGAQVSAVDPAPAFVAIARARYPGLPVRLGDARSISESDLGGILAWYSLIHLDPQEWPEVLAGFAGALRPGGGLCLGAFSGPELRPFDHAVTTAWAWPIPRLVEAVSEAGFVITQTRRRIDDGARRAHAGLLAMRR